MKCADVIQFLKRLLLCSAFCRISQTALAFSTDAYFSAVFFLDMSFRVTIFVSCQFLAADPAHQEASSLGGDILCVGYGF